MACASGAPVAQARPQQSPGQRAGAPANTPPGNSSPGNSSDASGTPARSPDLLAPLVTQAQQALDRGDYDAAVGLLKQILAQRPDEALPHFELGYAYSELKRNAEAAAEYRRALELDPSLVAAHLNLGLVLLASDPAAAVESFRRAAALAPTEPRPRYLAGQALERAGKLAGRHCGIQCGVVDRSAGSAAQVRAGSRSVGCRANSRGRVAFSRSYCARSLRRGKRHTESPGGK